MRMYKPTHSFSIANHPDLVLKKTGDDKQLVCMLCNDTPEDAIRASCRHIFCREVKWIRYNALEQDTDTCICFSALFDILQALMMKMHPAMKYPSAQYAFPTFLSTSVNLQWNLYMKKAYMQHMQRPVLSIVSTWTSGEVQPRLKHLLRSYQSCELKIVPSRGKCTVCAQKGIPSSSISLSFIIASCFHR